MENRMIRLAIEGVNTLNKTPGKKNICKIGPSPHIRIYTPIEAFCFALKKL